MKFHVACSRHSWRARRAVARCPRSKPRPGSRARWRISKRARSPACRSRATARLTLAPVVKEIFDPSVAFLWAVARDSKGNVYAGGGGLGGTKAKLFVVDPGGQNRRHWRSSTASRSRPSPSTDRIASTPRRRPTERSIASTPTGKAEVFTIPRRSTSGRWRFRQSGDLYVATGDQGEIHRVTPAGAGRCFSRPKRPTRDRSPWTRTAI